jgi:hypothetical protein
MFCTRPRANDRMPPRLNLHASNEHGAH